MIVYENENARLLIEDGEINLADTLLSQYIGTRHSLYITEKTALCLYNMYYKKEIEDNHRQEAMWINSYVENENDVIICRMIFIATIMKNDIY